MLALEGKVQRMFALIQFAEEKPVTMSWLI